MYAELLAFPGRSEAFLDSFLRETGITVDWEMDERYGERRAACFRPMPRAADGSATPGRVAYWLTF